MYSNQNGTTVRVINNTLQSVLLGWIQNFGISRLVQVRTKINKEQKSPPCRLLCLSSFGYWENLGRSVQGHRITRKQMQLQYIYLTALFACFKKNIYKIRMMMKHFFFTWKENITSLTATVIIYKHKIIFSTLVSFYFFINVLVYQFQTRLT